MKILLWLVAIVLLINILTTLVIEPWIGKKIETALNEKNRAYIIKINEVHISLIKSGIELENIHISSSRANGGKPYLNGQIASAKLKGIKLAKAIFKRDIEIREVIFSNLNIKGKIPFPEKSKPPIVSSLNIRIGNILLDKINLAIENTLTAKAYTITGGVLKMHDLQVEKHDTLTPGIVKQFDFKAKELLSISDDSMYMYKASGVIYAAYSKTLAADSFLIHPNYVDYDFSTRHKYESDRIEARISNIHLFNFSVPDYLKSRRLVSSYIEIGKLDLKAFRDKRKIFRHVNKPMFQNMIYNYHGSINIDSIVVINGNISYTEHAEKAEKPGHISFNEINVKIYRITNDTIYKTKNASLILKGRALVMGTGKINILLKAKLFERHNTFTLRGTLTDLEAKELNPILKESVYMYATSGKIDAMNFNFTANNTKATGRMTMRFHGMDVAIINKRTVDTTGIIEKVKSIFANKKMKDSNSAEHNNVREGIIYYERDPEKFLFNYCFESILSGIKSSLSKSPMKKKKS